MLQWRAVYKEQDGTISKRDMYGQFNADGSENPYKNIDRNKLGRFDLLKEDGVTIVHSLFLYEGQRLIFRRRNFIPLNGGKRTMAYILGWARTIYLGNGQKEDIYSLMYIFEDGTTAHDNHRDNLELLPEEL